MKKKRHESRRGTVWEEKGNQQEVGGETKEADRDVNTIKVLTLSNCYTLKEEHRPGVKTDLDVNPGFDALWLCS
jgi:hypothetical protein